jgi:hypothetical protein
LQSELFISGENGQGMDESDVIGGSCGTVSPESRNECCKNRGFSIWDKEDNECKNLDEEDETNEKETMGEGRGKEVVLKKSLESKKEGEEELQNKVRNQNQVREAIKSLLSLENRVGGIGPQVSAIAKNFNDRINISLKAEEKIQERSRFTRFFAGGDEDSAEELKAQTKENKEEIKELKILSEDCNCDNETKSIMKEQLMVMINENGRLQELVQSERKSKGIFGWLWK